MAVRFCVFPSIVLSAGQQCECKSGACSLFRGLWPRNMSCDIIRTLVFYPVSSILFFFDWTRLSFISGSVVRSAGQQNAGAEHVLCCVACGHGTYHSISFEPLSYPASSIFLFFRLNSFLFYLVEMTRRSVLTPQANLLHEYSSRLWYW